ncbi:MAG: M4 family metallopeptidase, partial [Acidobacteriota bacterium]|nr:M4 family metallopeptidase [Acidobacteriota bacterium]
PHVRRAPQVFDYVVDAHTGELVAELPRSQSLTEKAPDATGRVRTFGCTRNGSARHLHDPATNVHTFDFGFRSVYTNAGRLPGDYVANPPAPWNPVAVSAHANAAEVMRYVKGVLKRNGLDNLGGAIRSSINCVEDSGTKVWDNAMWFRDQMMYGQSLVGEEFRSWALAKDIVAHELTHGLTDYTARLEYLGESGALNESYADIFGVILANEGRASVAKWDWLIGANLTGDGEALRSMKRPRDFEQPDHMDDYQRLPNTEDGDWGGVHVNSGIHNKAAYHLLTARGASGQPVFKPREVAALFYLALTQHLSRTSRFADSRRGVELAARSLFAARSNKNVLFKAVGRAFDRVGIV